MDLEAKKKALQMIGYGLYVLTAQTGNDRTAITVTWVSQASFKPPIVSVGIEKGGHTYSILEKGGTFALHILSQQQKDVAKTFFKPGQWEGTKVGGLEFKASSSGTPILQDVPAFVECKVVGSHVAGDHVVFFGEVMDAGLRCAEPALALRDTPWHYGG